MSFILRTLLWRINGDDDDDDEEIRHLTKNTLLHYMLRLCRRFHIVVFSFNV